MEKGDFSSERQDKPSFEPMERSRWYEVDTENPLLDLDENRRVSGMNGALIAEVLLAQERLLQVIDFGMPGAPKAIAWHPDVGEIKALGMIRERFGIVAANYTPDGRLIGLSPLPAGRTVLGRNMGSASYLVGLGADATNTENLTISRQHLFIHVDEDEQRIFLKDESSTNGTQIHIVKYNRDVQGYL